MAEVKIPFLERFREPMLNGTKYMTSRTKRYGKKGDTFTAFGAEFKLLNDPFLLPLKNIIMEWKAEGFESIGDFQLTWCQIHPRRKFEDLEEKFWVHVFRRVGRAHLKNSC